VPEGDDELIERSLAGESAALSELLGRHGPSVGQVWQAVLEPADVMQVTYLEAFLRIRTFDRTRASFPTWLRAIAENNLRDAIRALEREKQPQPNRRIRPAMHEDSLVGLYNLLGTESATPSLRMRREEITRLLERAIDGLPERYAQVVRLYDLECRSIAEVAEATGR
jgi:RNA polymerase sigma-70 factor (ECF subfamily)